MRAVFFLATCITILTVGQASGATRYVDDSVASSGGGTSWGTAFKTIQKGIDASSEGDTVIVAEGTYFENVQLNGKNIILQSTDPKDPAVVANTVIDGGDADSVVAFSGTETEACVLSGFTIRNGNATSGGGIHGGAYPDFTHATIENNTITGNSAEYGGGMCYCHGTIQDNTITSNSAEYGGGVSYCHGTIENNAIMGNSAASRGGGLSSCHGTIRNNRITNNSAGGDGGGLQGCPATIESNTIADNSAVDEGGALWWCNGTILNCIIWGNTAPTGPQLYDSVTPNHSCIQDWAGGGTGSMDTDPAFVDADGPDNDPETYDDNNYRLSAASPCIDAGMNEDCMQGAVDLDGNPRIINGTVDMGAYEWRRGAVTWYVVPPPLGSDENPGTAEQPFATIQKGIDAASDGDAVIVVEGTYVENVHFDGKNIILQSRDPTDPGVVANTVIDGSDVGSVVTFSGTEDETCVLSGFTITNGGPGINGGTYADRTLATIQNNVIIGNSGSGLGYCDGTIQNNVISGNDGTEGGALCDCDGPILGNLIVGNSATSGDGGGLYDCDGLIANNTIVENVAANTGGGLSECYGTIQNCIIWGNAAVISPAQLSGSSVPTYSCIQDWSGGGEGNISEDPQFVDAAWNNYRLPGDSPCIDAGMNEDWMYSATDLDRNPRILYGSLSLTVDMGAYEFVRGPDEDFTEALDPSEWQLYGDATHDLDHGWIQLTPDEQSHASSIFYLRPINTVSFTATFDVYLGDHDGGDGLVFAFVKEPGLGQGGGQMGFLTGLDGYGIEFDTYAGRDATPGNQPDTENHVGVSKAEPGTTWDKGFAFYQNDSLPYDLENDTWFSAEVYFRSGHVWMWMWNDSVGWERELVIDYVIPDWQDYDAYLGFTATTGGVSNRQLVDNVTFAAAPTWYVDDSVASSGDGTSWGTAFQTIQEGINASSDGDSVMVAEGTYVENVQFNGKNILLTSTDPLNPSVVAGTIIDGNEDGSVVSFSGFETEACVLSGFTIRNGYAGYGGGIFGGDSPHFTYATIQNNTIVGNTGVFGGGLYQCGGTIENNTIVGNSALLHGGGLMWLWDSAGTIRNNTITGNSANDKGGGLWGCDGTIQNNMISDNSAGTYGGGLCMCSGTIQNNVISGNSANYSGGLAYCGGIIQNNTITDNSAGTRGGGLGECTGMIQNCIIWGNTAPTGPQLHETSTPTYSCIQEWSGGGEGNIATDPAFVDADGPDNDPETYDDNNYRLSAGSPCIDVGLNEGWMQGAVDLEGNPRIINGTVDMGAYEFVGGPDIETGLVGHWKLDETSGDVAHDSSGNDNHGTLLGNPQWVAGKVGGALQFDGTDDCVDCGDDPLFSITGDLTVACWFKVNQFDVGYQALVAKGGYTWRLQRDGTNSTLEFSCTGAGGAYGNVDVSDGEWHHVAGVYDGSTMYLYVDGGLDVFQGASGTIDTNTYNLFIGENSQDTGRHWNGWIDDVRVYSRPLSAADIRELYSWTGPVDTTPPVITVPADMVVEATGPEGAVVTFAVSATDLVDPNPTVTADPDSGSTFALGTTTVQVTATDSSGNSSSDSFTATVQDTTAPVITVPTNMAVEATGPDGAVVIFTVSATDLVEPNPTVTANPDSGSTFPMGATTVNVTATDGSNNPSTASFKVTVEDTTAPVITLLGDNPMTLQVGTPYVEPGYTATDNYDGDISASVTVSGSVDHMALGTYTLSYNVSDSNGNGASYQVRTVNVVDTRVFEILEIGEVAQQMNALTWVSVPDETYTIWSCSDLVNGLWNEEDVIASQGLLTTWVDPNATSPQKFYRIEVN